VSKNQNKQVFNATNDTLSGVRNQGAANNTQLQNSYSGFSNNANAIFPGVLAGYQGFAGEGGGYDPATLALINSTYGDLAAGGISPEQISAMTGQASDASRSAYKVAGDKMQRQIAATGGYGFSGAASSQLARQGSDAASRAARDVNASIVGMQSQNKAIGAAGLNTVQQGVTGNRLQGLSGQQGLYNTNVGASQQNLQQIIQNFATTGQLSAEDLRILSQIAQTNPNWWENVTNAIGGIGKAAGSVASGISGISGAIGAISGGGE